MMDKASFTVRRARTSVDIARAQAFRARCFGRSTLLDQDEFDDLCMHILIEDVRTGEIACCFRMHCLQRGHVGSGYSGQFYDLSLLHRFPGEIVEVGRFCVDPACRNPDVLRLAWAALTRYVDDHDVGLLTGCSSFHGVDASKYVDVFATLTKRHLAPDMWAPRVKVKDVVTLSGDKGRTIDHKKALQTMPPLLRSYLMMGGWVSDHAVIDHLMNTLHVFTGVEIVGIPEARKRALRTLGASLSDVF